MNDVEKKAPPPEFQPQPFAAFMAKKLPPKTPLIEGVLFRRDRISLTGRRRNGKTTFLLNLALAGALGHREYLGHEIPNPFTTVAFYLEDDAREVQDKLKLMAAEQTTDRFHLYTQEDFFDRKVPVNLTHTQFRDFIADACAAAKPDLIILDNLGQLIGGDYNNAPKIQTLMELVFRLGRKYDAAVLIAAHPRKGAKVDDGSSPITLRSSPEKFFEECMGSSHFINTTGSLWGIERDYDEGRSYIVLGSQRVTGTEAMTAVEKNEAHWFERIDNFALSMEAAVNTVQRREAWARLPENGSFTYVEARDLAKGAIKSSSTFNAWWKELRRHKLIVETASGKYEKAKAAAASNPQKDAKKPAQSPQVIKARTDASTDAILPGSRDVDLNAAKKAQEAWEEANARAARVQ